VRTFRYRILNYASPFVIMHSKRVYSMRWAEEEKQLLIAKYEHTKKQELLDLLGRDWQSIVSKANNLSLRRSSDNKRLGSILRLLENGHEAMYWLGFLFADGHFSKQGSIMCDVGRVDRVHLEKLALFLGGIVIYDYERQTSYSKTKKPYSRLSICDPKRMLTITEKFNIHSNKTHNPINADSLTSHELLSVLIGFFDGDGGMQKSGSGSFFGSIRCSASWLPIFEKWKNTLLPLIGDGSEPKLDAKGSAKWVLSGSQMRKMKQHAENHNLPVMERKWDKVIASKIQERLAKDEVHEIRLSQKTVSELCREYNVSSQTIRSVKHGHTYK
jgi:hypothetical protein